MYAESVLLFPGLPISPEFHRFQKPTSNVVQTNVSEYDLGGEGDLFKAPEPIMEEPVLELDPMTLVSMISSDEDITTQSIKTSSLSEYDVDNIFKAPEPIIEDQLLEYDPMPAAISMISCGEHAISAQMIKAADIESFQSDHLLNEVFYECEKDLMEKSTIDESHSKVLDVKIPAIRKEEGLTIERDELITWSTMPKSVSSSSLSSMELINGEAMRPNLLDFHMMNFGTALGMRRAFSEGDIQTLHTWHTLGQFPFEQMPTIGNYTSEERKLQLSRYRIKKTKRNFGRKIKYACRKALADSQPRVRGRFAKSEGAYVSNTLKLDECKHSIERQVKGGPVEETARIENPSLRLGGSISRFRYCQEPATTGSLSSLCRDDVSR